MSEAIDNFLETLYSDRVVAKAKTIPDTLTFEDENGEPLEDFGTVALTWPMKLSIAEQSIRWRQSLQTTVIRILMVHANRVIRTHEKGNIK